MYPEWTGTKWRSGRGLGSGGRQMALQSTTLFEFGRLTVEDIIGLKLQALVNDPSRKDTDLADIRALLVAKRAREEVVDWRLLEDYFQLFDMNHLLTELRSDA